MPLGEGAAPLGLDARIEAIASTSETPTAVTLTLSQADGSLKIDGRACAAPAGFSGKITLDALALAPLLRIVAPGAGVQVAGGVAKGELELKLGSLAKGETPAPGGDLHLAGAITLDGLEVKTDSEVTLGTRARARPAGARATTRFCWSYRGCCRRPTPHCPSKGRDDCALRAPSRSRASPRRAGRRASSASS